MQDADKQTELKVSTRDRTTDKPTSRGRPRSEEKRRAIYEAASVLFLDSGYDNVSMDRVAEQAGVSKQTVYSYFSSKEALFCACIEEKCDSYGLTSNLFDVTLPIRDTLTLAGHKFSQMLLSDDAIRLKRLLCAHAESNPRLGALFFDAGPRRLMTLLDAYLSQLTTLGKLQIQDTAIATRQFLYMLQQETHMRRLLNVPDSSDTPDDDRYIDECVSLFLDHYGREKGSTSAS